LNVVSPITSDPSVKSVVIQDYLNGISRDQIARQRSIASGSVSNIIKKWKQEMQGSNVDEIRSFSKTVYNSGISIYQCARGYRMEKILNNLGVYDEYDNFEEEKEIVIGQGGSSGGIGGEVRREEGGDDMYKINQNRDDSGNRSRTFGDGIYSIYNTNKSNTNNIINSKDIKNKNKVKKEENTHDDFSFFVNQIYRNCIKYGVLPSIVPYWIKDLMDIFNEPDLGNHKFAAALNSNYISENNNKENEKSDFDCIQNNNDDNNTLPINDRGLYQQQQQYRHQLQYQHQQLNSHHNTHIKRIPFVSQVSRYIAQSKREYSKLEYSKSKIKDEINLLYLQKNQAAKDLYKIIQRENKVIRYIGFINRLKKELWEKYSIRLQEDIESFAKVINDFKKNDFDCSKIMLEYITSISIEDNININQQQVNELEQRKSILIDSVNYLQNEVNLHSQTINTYSQLKDMGFNLEKLKQLYNIIIEIANENNNMSSEKEALSKFFEDIENEYDNNLGFEAKIKKKKEELVLLSTQVNNNRTILQLQPIVGPTLISLFQKGITEQDIINANHHQQLVDKDKIEKEKEKHNEKLEHQGEDYRGDDNDRRGGGGEGKKGKDNTCFSNSKNNNIPIKHEKHQQSSVSAITDNLKKYKDTTAKIKKSIKKNKFMTECKQRLTNYTNKKKSNRTM
jgi:hypothetical protein